MLSSSTACRVPHAAAQVEGCELLPLRGLPLGREPHPDSVRLLLVSAGAGTSALTEELRIESSPDAWDQLNDSCCDMSCWELYECQLVFIELSRVAVSTITLSTVTSRPLLSTCIRPRH